MPKPSPRRAAPLVAAACGDDLPTAARSGGALSKGCGRTNKAGAEPKRMPKPKQGLSRQQRAGKTPFLNPDGWHFGASYPPPANNFLNSRWGFEFSY